MELFKLLVGVDEFMGLMFAELSGIELLVWLFDGLVNGTLTTVGAAMGVASIYLAVIFGIMSCPLEIET